MIVSSKESPVKASVVQFDNAKVQFAFDGVDRKADEVNLASGETDGDDDDSNIDKRQVDVDHSDGAYLSNNLSGLSTRTWEERRSADNDEGWADDNAWDGKNEREAPPIAPAASDTLDKIREMRQILEADPNLKETLSKSESMSNPESNVRPGTSSNALDALRSVRMQLEANKDVAKAVSDTLHATPRAGLPPRSPAKGNLSARSFFKKSTPNDSMPLPESSQTPREEGNDQGLDGVEEEGVDDLSVASLVGPPPPPPPPPIRMKRSEGSVQESTPACIPDEPLVPTPDSSSWFTHQEEESNPKWADNVEEGNIQDVSTASEACPTPHPPVRGKVSMRRFFKKGASRGDQKVLPDSSPSEDSNQKSDDADEGDVQDPSVEVVFKGYAATETHESHHSKSRRRGVKNLFKKLGRKNRTGMPDLSPDNIEGEDVSGQFDKGDNFPRVFSSDSYIDEGAMNMNTCRADEVEDDESVGAAPSSGFCCASNVNNRVKADEVPSRENFITDKATVTSLEPDTVDASDFVNAIDFHSHKFTMDIGVKEIERKMKQKRATDASISSSRGPASLAGTAGKKIGQLSSTASVKSARTSKSAKSSKNRQSHNMKQKKPAIYHSGKLAGNAGTTKRGDHGKLRDDNISYTRWPQK